MATTIGVTLMSFQVPLLAYALFSITYVLVPGSTLVSALSAVVAGAIGLFAGSIVFWKVALERR